MSNQFIKVPKTLLDLGISVDAKYIYMLLLDRYTLSITNNWIDDNNKYYIYYTISEIEKATSFTKKRVIKAMKELEQNDLIYRKRQGQGKPARIYLVQGPAKTENTMADIFFDAFGRNPDKSFVAATTKYGDNVVLDAISMAASKSPKKPEAYIMALLKRNATPKTSDKLEAWEKEWLDDIKKYESTDATSSSL